MRRRPKRSESQPPTHHGHRGDRRRPEVERSRPGRRRGRARPRGSTAAPAPGTSRRPAAAQSSSPLNAPRVPRNERNESIAKRVHLARRRRRSARADDGDRAAGRRASRIGSTTNTRHRQDAAGDEEERRLEARCSRRGTARRCRRSAWPIEAPANITPLASAALVLLQRAHRQRVDRHVLHRAEACCGRAGSTVNSHSCSGSFSSTRRQQRRRHQHLGDDDPAAPAPEALRGEHVDQRPERPLERPGQVERGDEGADLGRARRPGGATAWRPRWRQSPAGCPR